ncbi:MAG: transporter substrate-binding domain-containing protein [Lachnospiraceae bacterium]
MKKLLTAILALALVLGCAACTPKKETPAPTPAASEKTITVGILEMNDAEAGKTYDSIIAAKLPAYVKVTPYNSLTTILAAVNGGKVDTIEIPRIVAEYLKTTDPKLTEVPSPSNEHSVFFRFAFKKDNTADRDLLNNGLTTLTTNGTLATLEEKYVTANVVDSSEVVLPKTDGAKTIKVGVTGDIPPMDYVSADGKPSGFNVALLAALGSELKINFELVTIESDARLIALEQGTVDMLFWIRSNNPEIDTETAERYAVTTSYLKTNGCALSNMSAEEIAAMIKEAENK